VRPSHRLARRLQAFTQPTVVHHSYILSVGLTDWRAPDFTASLEVDFRTATTDDAEALSWGYFNGDRIAERMLAESLASRHKCYVATADGEIVGYSWTWFEGFSCHYLGAQLDWPEGTCYGGDMRVAREYRRKHVGLGLLAHGLQDARDRGYDRKVCWVLAHNEKMLGAIGQLGYRVTGEIRRTGWFPLHGSRLGPNSTGFFERFSTLSWKSDGRSGRGEPIVL
jgi:GNAT superfamily N-acetyltransferase